MALPGLWGILWGLFAKIHGFEGGNRGPFGLNADMSIPAKHLTAYVTG
jgi:hypothetical protein